MGSIFGKAMDENLKKQQEFMLQMQTLQVSYFLVFLSFHLLPVQLMRIISTVIIMVGEF